MRVAAYLLVTLGGLLCVLSFYFSFVRFRVYKLRTKQSDYRPVSGIPLFGSVFVVIALLVLREPNWLIVVGAVVAALDTGGPHWFVGTMTFMGARDVLFSRRS